MVLPTLAPVAPDLGKQGLSPWKLKWLAQNDPEELVKVLSGVGQGIKLEASPPFNGGDCEYALRSIGGNAFIILGRDRPGRLMSGYGGLEDNRACSAIRITAGLGGKDVKEVDADKNPLGLNPNNQIDAATIYLSQKTDIDDSEQGFNLAAGTCGKIYKRSAIAVKADSVRIISGDGGIKFVTSATSVNSQGGPIEQYADINFICGNDETQLQPLVRGNNLRLVVDKIFTIMAEICTTINQIVAQQSKFNIAIKSHTHGVPELHIPPMVTKGGFGTGASATGGPVTTSVSPMEVIPPPPRLVGLGPMAFGSTFIDPILESIGVETVNIHLGITSQRVVGLRNKSWATNKNATQNNNSPLYLLSKNIHAT